MTLPSTHWPTREPARPTRSNHAMYFCERCPCRKTGRSWPGLVALRDEEFGRRKIQCLTWPRRAFAPTVPGSGNKMIIRLRTGINLVAINDHGILTMAVTNSNCFDFESISHPFRIRCCHCTKNQHRQAHSFPSPSSAPSAGQLRWRFTSPTSPSTPSTSSCVYVRFLRSPPRWSLVGSMPHPGCPCCPCCPYHITDTCWFLMNDL
jgi:hypothetical protein